MLIYNSNIMRRVWTTSILSLEAKRWLSGWKAKYCAEFTNFFNDIF